MFVFTTVQYCTITTISDYNFVVPGFLKLFLCGGLYTYMCVCVSASEAIITSDMCSMIWTPYDWLNKFYSFYMAAVVILVVGMP